MMSTIVHLEGKSLIKEELLANRAVTARSDRVISVASSASSPDTCSSSCSSLAIIPIGAAGRRMDSFVPMA